MKKLVVVSSAPLVYIDKQWFLYGPYEKEMQLWAKYANEIQFCCPVWKVDKKLLITNVSFPMLPAIELREFDVLTLKNALSAIPSILQNAVTIYRAMKSADHIHLRCPGNMALLASVVQIAFPKKKKTAKYAGNWDPNSKQPLSYRLQKWILSNTILTKNMQVLVYGEWPNQTKNIKSFFTATYSDSDKKEIKIRSLTDKIRFLFVGMLSEGKQPLYAAQLIKALIVNGYTIQLDYYGDGKMHNEIEKFIIDEDLKGKIIIQGNQSKETLEKAYQVSNFLVLPSKSEGWPKVVAEAMFWGCVPIVIPVSCVPYMLDYGNRGIVLQMNLEYDTKQIEKVLQDTSCYTKMALNGMEWSREFTTDKFQKEIKKLLSI
jgi:glycosyltransferase involved in cell wall biosynthesis